MDVLLGVGGGEDSRRALERTIERTREADDDLTVAVFATEGESVEDVAAMVERALEAADIDADVRRIEGHPASTLVELAETEGYDQLVIGGGQRSPMGKIELGSITEFVLLNSQVTVRLIR